MHGMDKWNGLISSNTITAIRSEGLGRIVSIQTLLARYYRSLSFRPMAPLFFIRDYIGALPNFMTTKE
jgi:hypothetical protein